MSDFSDRPFIAGSLIGVRAFTLDPEGYLTGVIHTARWDAGTSIGECRKGQDSFSAAIRTFGASLEQTTWALTKTMFDLSGKVLLRKKPRPPAPKKPVEVGPDHQVGSVDCTCGFYAYFDTGANPYAQARSRVIGLVEGFGVVTVGSRGFRASKARIKALVAPDEDTIRRRAFTQALTLYPDVPLFPTLDDALLAFPLSTPLSREAAAS